MPPKVRQSKVVFTCPPSCNKDISLDDMIKIITNEAFFTISHTERIRTCQCGRIFLIKIARLSPEKLNLSVKGLERDARFNIVIPTEGLR